MSNQQDAPSRSDMIRCEFCGEEYSVTYRKCPFCDDMAGQPAPRPSSGTTKGGKRQVGSSRGGFSLPRLNIEPVRIIGYALGLILIVAAIYIVYSLLAPLFGGSDTPAVSDSSVQSSVSVSASVSQTLPEISTSAPGVSTSTPDVSTPDVSTPDVSTPDVSTPDVSTPTTPTTPVAAGTMGTINSDDVLIRKAPATGEKKDTGYANSEVKILESTTVDGHVWYKIQYETGGGKTDTGYIRSDLVTVKSN